MKTILFLLINNKLWGIKQQGAPIWRALLYIDFFESVIQMV